LFSRASLSKLFRMRYCTVIIKSIHRLRQGDRLNTRLVKYHTSMVTCDKSDGYLTSSVTDHRVILFAKYEGKLSWSRIRVYVNDTSYN